MAVRSRKGVGRLRRRGLEVIDAVFLQTGEIGAGPIARAIDEIERMHAVDADEQDVLDVGPTVVGAPRIGGDGERRRADRGSGDDMLDHGFPPSIGGPASLRRKPLFRQRRERRGAFRANEGVESSDQKCRLPQMRGGDIGCCNRCRIWSALLCNADFLRARRLTRRRVEKLDHSFMTFSAALIEAILERCLLLARSSFGAFQRASATARSRLAGRPAGSP